MKRVSNYRKEKKKNQPYPVLNLFPKKIEGKGHQLLLC